MRILNDYAFLLVSSDKLFENHKNAFIAKLVNIAQEEGLEVRINDLQSEITKELEKFKKDMPFNAIQDIIQEQSKLILEQEQANR